MSNFLSDHVKIKLKRYFHQSYNLQDFYNKLNHYFFIVNPKKEDNADLTKIEKIINTIRKSVCLLNLRDDLIRDCFYTIHYFASTVLTLRTCYGCGNPVVIFKNQQSGLLNYNCTCCGLTLQFHIKDLQSINSPYLEDDSIIKNHPENYTPDNSLLQKAKVLIHKIEKEEFKLNYTKKTAPTTARIFTEFINEYNFEQPTGTSWPTSPMQNTGSYTSLDSESRNL